VFIEQLKAGTKVRVLLQEESVADGYLCKIIKLIPEKRQVFIHAPVENDKTVELEAGTELVIKLMTDNASYNFKASLMAYTEINGYDIVRLQIVNDGEKVQRRSAFRFNCSIPTTFKIIYTDGQQAEDEEGLVTDLSAGGTKIFANKSIPEGSLLNISLPLGEDTNIVAFGDIRLKLSTPDNAKYAYQYGVRFTMMPEADQELIIKYTYKMQREELKKARPR
jgi:c-di-GMP-binding flagellar brake protein YcgR